MQSTLSESAIPFALVGYSERQHDLSEMAAGVGLLPRRICGGPVRQTPRLFALIAVAARLVVRQQVVRHLRANGTGLELYHCETKS